MRWYAAPERWCTGSYLKDRLARRSHTRQENTWTRNDCVPVHGDELRTVQPSRAAHGRGNTTERGVLRVNRGLAVINVNMECRLQNKGIWGEKFNLGAEETKERGNGGCAALAVKQCRGAFRRRQAQRLNSRGIVAREEDTRKLRWPKFLLQIYLHLDLYRSLRILASLRRRSHAALLRLGAR